MAEKLEQTENWKNRNVQREDCLLNLDDYWAKHRIMQILKSATSELLEEQPEERPLNALADKIIKMNDDDTVDDFDGSEDGSED